MQEVNRSRKRLSITHGVAKLLQRPQRTIAVRVIRGYRTISFEAACVLAGTPPWVLEAEALAADYQWRANLRARGMARPSPSVVRARRAQSRRSVLESWSRRLADPSAGRRTVEAIRPVLVDWVNRDRGCLTFRLTQVLTGHGCFGEFLHRIGAEPTAECHHCDCDLDTAEHTLVACPAWEGWRRVLVAKIGNDLSLPSVVASMLGDDESWKAMLDFCECTISQKEAAGRVRDAQSRRRRAGAREADLAQALAL